MNMTLDPTSTFLWFWSRNGNGVLLNCRFAIIFGQVTGTIFGSLLNVRTHDNIMSAWL